LRVQVACLGDIMLDVLVDAQTGLSRDDDTPARITFAAGGQAANVAGWVHEYGGRARLFGPRAARGPGRFVADALEAAGIEVHGPVTGHSGTVVSLLSAGTRSLASDPGSSAWLGDVQPGPWLEGADWLFVSGYALLRAPRPEVFGEIASAARAAGTKVAVDLASASLVTAYGPARFRGLWQSMRPDAVLANELEWAATQGPGEAVEVPGYGAGGTSVLVLKQGAKGCSFVIDGVVDHRLPVPGPVHDVTGAGDALAAGFLLGGPDLAMQLAARCVARVGAGPRELPELP
jgi:sugar/nucleoside kinase (ribokinase family)